MGDSDSKILLIPPPIVSADRFACPRGESTHRHREEKSWRAECPTVAPPYNPFANRFRRFFAHPGGDGWFRRPAFALYADMCPTRWKAKSHKTARKSQLPAC